ncbi:hypothetical protein ACFQX6_22975 [Streptosporangium lutulentum]
MVRRLQPGRLAAGHRGRRPDRAALGHRHRPHLHALTGHTHRIWSLAFSPAGDLLASAGDDGAVILWNLPWHRSHPAGGPPRPARGVGGDRSGRPLQTRGRGDRPVLVRRRHAEVRARRAGRLPAGDREDPLDAEF